jgi:hypothetical protein
MAIEELKDLDGDLAAVVKAVTELRRRKPAIRSMSGDVDGDFRHGLHHRSQEEMIVRDFIGITASCRHAQQAAHKGLIDVHGSGDVTHAWRPEGLDGEPGPGQSPDFLLLLGELDLMVRPPHPHPIEHDLACLDQPFDGRQKQRRRQQRLVASAQLFKPDARDVGALGMERVEASHHPRLQPIPVGGQHGDAAGTGRQQNERKLGLDARGKRRSNGTIAKKGVKIEPPARTCQRPCQRLGSIAVCQRLDLSAPLEEVSRTTKRSPTTAASGRSNTN